MIQGRMWKCLGVSVRQGGGKRGRKQQQQKKKKKLKDS